MNVVERDIASILFPETSPPPNVSQGLARDVHDHFWRDPYCKNLRLDDVELEVRLGRCNGRNFDASVSQRTFAMLSESFQQYTKWDAVNNETSSVAYFETRDDSLRAVTDAAGTRYISKQRVCISDFYVENGAYDFRIAASLEIAVNDRPSIESSTRRVTRDRVSYSLGNWRYDLTIVTTESNDVTYQVEIELIDPVAVQCSNKDATALATELGARLRDVLNVLESDQKALRIVHRRRRWY